MFGDSSMSGKNKKKLIREMIDPRILWAQTFTCKCSFKKSGVKRDDINILRKLGEMVKLFMFVGEFLLSICNGRGGGGKDVQLYNIRNFPEVLMSSLRKTCFFKLCFITFLSFSSSKDVLTSAYLTLLSAFYE